MKASFFFVFVILLVIGCNRNSSNIQKQQKETTKIKLENFYGIVNKDTIRTIQEIKIDSNNYQLEFKLFSLNDSAVVNIEENLKFICHNYASEILLRFEKDTILHKRITKELFKDSIPSEEYNFMNLSGIGYRRNHLNKLYFNVGFDNPPIPLRVLHKDCDISIYFRTSKKGEISIGSYTSIIDRD